MVQRNTRTRDRRGTVLPLFAFAIVAICGFVALSVDIGLIALAKTQAQNAADAAALAGARTIDGSSNSNLSVASSNASAAAVANQILGQSIQASQVTLVHGAYHYDATNKVFVPQFPPVSPDNYNLTKATVNASISNQFAKVLGLSLSNVTCTAIAAHRPRDIAIVLDYSGSMNNESDLWNCESYSRKHAGHVEQHRSGLP